MKQVKWIDLVNHLITKLKSIFNFVYTMRF